MQQYIPLCVKASFHFICLFGLWLLIGFITHWLDETKDARYHPGEVIC